MDQHRGVQDTTSETGGVAAFTVRDACLMQCVSKPVVVYGEWCAIDGICWPRPPATHSRVVYLPTGDTGICQRDADHPDGAVERAMASTSAEVPAGVLDVLDDTLCEMCSAALNCYLCLQYVLSCCKRASIPNLD